MSAKVLVVEDDRAACEGLVALLANAGYDTLATTSYEAGRFALRRDKPDLLIVDVRLGEFNGLQLLIAAGTQIPAIVVSGFGDPTLEAEARKLGADYLVKPMTPSHLLAAVERKLALRVFRDAYTP